MAAAVSQEAGLLQRVCDDRHAGSPDAHHLRYEFLGQQQIIPTLQVAAAQQPSREARLDCVGRVACGGLLRLHQKKLLVPEESCAAGRAGVGQGAKLFGIEHGARAGDLHDRLADRNLSVQPG